MKIYRWTHTRENIRNRFQKYATTIYIAVIKEPYFKFEININITFIFVHRKINDNENLSLHHRSIEQSRQNDYLETVAFVSSSRTPTTCVNEAEINRTEVKQDQEARKPEESIATQPNDKSKIHLYHNVFRKGSYENV